MNFARNSLSHHFPFLLFFLWTFQTNAQEILVPPTVVIPAGEFLSGTTPLESEEYFIPLSEPASQLVSLPTFAIGQYEVTYNEYYCFMRDGGYLNPSYWSDEGWRYRQMFQWDSPYTWHDPRYKRFRQGQNPVSGVSWYEAEAYCRWLFEKTRKPFRLPTSLEWEKAARGTDGRIFPWGNEWIRDACNWKGDDDTNPLNNISIDDYIMPAPVGFYEHGKSTYGCYDMAGNVAEWCSDDWYDAREPDKETSYKIIRGGHFQSRYPRWLRCSWRGGTLPEIQHVYWGSVGFRVALDVE